ncbi:sugar phosphate isomerase/epimerase family protein [Hephaestia caeni]|nr:sugar phosphate isomerase/epimerase family protein [Hephaestia caeni]
MLADYVGSSDPVEQIAAMADLGFAGVFDNFLTLRDVQTQHAMGTACERRGLAFGSITLRTSHANRPDWHRSDSESRAAIAHALNNAIDAAGRVGSTNITVVSNADWSLPREPQISAFAENLRQVADRAALRGVKLNLEPTAGLEPALLIGRMAQARDLAVAIDHPAVQLVYDVGHVTSAGDDPFAALSMARDRLGAVQLAGAGRTEIGTGAIDWPRLLRAIRDTGYCGLYELEHRPPNDGIDGETALLSRLREVDDQINDGRDPPRHPAGAAEKR